MQIYNQSTNSYSFTAQWQDGTTQLFVMPPLSSAQVPAGIFPVLSGAGPVALADTYTSSYVVVNNDGPGFQTEAHANQTGVTYFMSGFYWMLPFLTVSLSCWAILKGFKLRPQSD